MNLDSVADNAVQSLKLIEPWRTASTALVNLIQDIQKHTLLYYEAIDLSIKTAEDGHAFSSDVIDLCDYLLDPNTDLKDIQDYVSTMQDKAKTAHEASNAILEKFKIVRQGLSEITDQIPVEVEKLQKTDNGQTQQLCENLAPVDITSGDKTEPPKRCVDYSIVMAVLNRATQDLKEFYESVNGFASWWMAIEPCLSTEKIRTNSLKPDKGQKLVIKSTQNGWRKIQGDCLEYKIKITKVQDYYPSQRPELEGEGVQA